MAQHHHYNIKDIEDLLPYERDFYMEMITNEMKKENNTI